MASLRLVRPLGKPRLVPYRSYVSIQRQRVGSNERTRGAPFSPSADEYQLKRLSPNTFSYASDGPDPEAEVQPGDHILAFCKKYQVSFPNVLRRIQGLKLMPNPFGLNIMVSDKHCFNKTSLKYLDKYEQPFTKSILEMYMAQKKNPLWYHTYSAPVTSPLPCRVATRRIRHAFRDALANYGYDRDGKKVSMDGSVIADLHGTVRIVCGDPKAVCNLKFAELVKVTNKIVSGIEPVLARDKYGKPVMINQQQQQQRHHHQQQQHQRPQRPQRSQAPQNPQRPQRPQHPQHPQHPQKPLRSQPYNKDQSSRSIWKSMDQKDQNKGKEQQSWNRAR
ncbi:hypothetical protein F5Y11DRAFT_340753 [Daldinia sp. FL1419]|nr:hypothetical protein F5Y11DRAFT_340753 [Daldinia sp. FL1419]